MTEHTDESVESFVAGLLDDWEGDEHRIFGEWGVGQDEYKSMVDEIAARRAEWAAIWDSTNGPNRTDGRHSAMDRSGGRCR